MTPRRSLVEQAHLPAGVGPRSWATRPSAWSRRASLTIPLCASLAVLFLAPLALGAPPRTYESKIEPGSVEVGGRTFEEPDALTIDSADNVWLSVLPGESGGSGQDSLISEYGSYPSQTKIGTQPNENGQNRFGSGGELAVNSANGFLYVASTPVSGIVDVYEGLGSFIPPQWENFFHSCPCSLGIGIDNSGAPSNGKVYVTENLFGEPSTIKAFNPEEAPVDFSAHEEYITANEITGTPSSPHLFRFLGAPVIDPTTADLYVVVNDQIDEFKPSGEFVQTINPEVPGGFGELGPIALDPTNGNLLIVDVSNHVIDELSPSGEYLGQLTGTSPSTPFLRLGQIAVNSNGHLYVVEPHENVVDIFSPRTAVPGIRYPAVSNTTPTSGTLNANIEPSGAGEEVTVCHFEYGSDISFSLGTLPCLDNADAEVGTSAHPITSETEVHAALSGLTTNTTYYYRAVAGNAKTARPGSSQTFVPHSVQAVHTESATSVGASDATLHGSFVGLGEDTEYYFQYGTDTTYGETSEVKDNGSGAGQQIVEPISIAGLQQDATYHYRLVARNSAGTTYGQDQTFKTLTKPSIDSLSASVPTATTAVLHTTIDPQGADTTYHFEYGTTTSYGASVTGEEDEFKSNLFTDHSVEVTLSNLVAGATYHFRVVAENAYGETVSEDQAFGFYPPKCPNAHLRQITHSTNLPDCRAYELVSPADAGGTTLFPEGPNSPEETTPARFAFGGVLGAIPGSGDPINTFGDLYVATRTDQGWTTKYVGIPADQALEANGPPNEANSDESYIFHLLQSPAGVRADTAMNKFLDWNDGRNGYGEGIPYNFTPHVWADDGSSLGEWPTATVADHTAENSSVSEVSPDFTHYVFQVGKPPSLSLIDNNTVDNTATVASKTASGEIPIQPGDSTPNTESLRVPAISSDGSHILIASRAEAEELCKDESGAAVKCPLDPSVLYMRVGDTITYEVSQGKAVDYVGMTPDGSKVYFTSEEHLTNEDPEHGGASLYMWSEEGEQQHSPIKLISKGDDSGEPGKPGNTEACNAAWTTKCGIVPYSNNGYTNVLAYGSPLGNGLSDNSIASSDGDIYFFSPEQLAGGRGVNGLENLYDYRNEHLQYVATFNPQRYCVEEEGLKYCSATPVVRMQVSPADTYMALLTASRLTSYNNAGHLEMYRYDPATERLICVSCLPDGEPPTTNVEASSDGIFMTNDGRTFFSTGDSLVPKDTDGLRDVYEYVEGHAQLISSGTSSKDSSRGVGAGINRELFTAGLVGVSGNGINVYFSTYDTLVGQDDNGSQLKFYDARTDGGFPYVAPQAPCEAADECHGAGSSSESAAANGSGADLGSDGNLVQVSRGHRRKHPKKHRKKHRRSHQGHRRRRGLDE